jgi:hypothetical protein
MAITFPCVQIIHIRGNYIHGKDRCNIVFDSDMGIFTAGGELLTNGFSVIKNSILLEGKPIDDKITNELIDAVKRKLNDKDFKCYFE